MSDFYLYNTLKTLETKEYNNVNDAFSRFLYLSHIVLREQNHGHSIPILLLCVKMGLQTDRVTDVAGLVDSVTHRPLP